MSTVKSIQELDSTIKDNARSYQEVVAVSLGNLTFDLMYEMAFLENRVRDLEEELFLHTRKTPQAAHGIKLSEPLQHHPV